MAPCTARSIYWCKANFNFLSNELYKRSKFKFYVNDGSQNLHGEKKKNDSAVYCLLNILNHITFHWIMFCVLAGCLFDPSNQKKRHIFDSIVDNILIRLACFCVTFFHQFSEYLDSHPIGFSLHSWFISRVLLIIALSKPKATRDRFTIAITMSTEEENEKDEFYQCMSISIKLNGVGSNISYLNFRSNWHSSINSVLSELKNKQNSSRIVHSHMFVWWLCIEVNDLRCLKH